MIGAPSVMPNGDVLVAGGHDAKVVDYATAELYDPTTNKWTFTGSLNTSRRYPVQVELANGEATSLLPAARMGQLDGLTLATGH